MFDALTDKLGRVFKSLRGRGKITAENVHEAMGAIRTALLEADVHVDIVRKFCDDASAKAIGLEILNTLQPEQVMVKVVHEELIRLMGPVDPRIPYVAPGPTVLLLAGLQGSGKTTTCGKLARLIAATGRRPLLVAADLKRPAAIDQLEVLGQQLGIPVYSERGHEKAVKVCKNGIVHARRNDRDVVILDTAGRLAIDEELMAEVAQIATVTKPHQIYLVIDAMTGQDAVNTARSFNSSLELDGVILTKFDSDTRGGAALSVKAITGKPIKFIGVGEKLENLEPFHPDRIAGRILGMGDVLSLVEQAQEQYETDEAERMQAKMAKGALTLDDFLQQFRKVQKMGSIKSLLKKLPGMGGQLDDMDIDEGELKRMEAIVLSMTRRERHNPDVIDASRRRRIARGAGCDPQDVSGLVKQFNQMRDVMKSMSGMNMGNRMRSLAALSQAAMSGQSIKTKHRTATAKPRRVNSRDKRRKRKKSSR